MVTEKSKQVFEWIRKYMLENGFCPSYKEICEGVGLKTKSTLFRYMKELEDLGLLVRKGGKYSGSPAYRLAGMKYVICDEEVI